MKEQRRARRIPLHLPVELKRDGWESMLTEDVSRRGLFLRTVGPCPAGQLLRLRVTVPGLEAPLDMMATVARRVESAAALRNGLLPGIGMEFFCLKDRALDLWDRFMLRLQQGLEGGEAEPAWKLTRRLLEGVGDGSGTSSPLEISGKPSAHESERDDRSGPETASGEGAIGRERSSLILRMTNDELDRFAREQLPTGCIDIRIPYRMEEDALVSVRIIHPRTDEELMLPGMLKAGADREHYQIDLGVQAPAALEGFRRFLRTGIPGRASSEAGH